MKLNFPEILGPLACSFFTAFSQPSTSVSFFLQSLFEQMVHFQRSEDKEQLSKCSSVSVQYVVLVFAI